MKKEFISLHCHGQWLVCAARVCMCVQQQERLYVSLPVSKEKNRYLCISVHVSLIELLITYEFSHSFLYLLVIHCFW